MSRGQHISLQSSTGAQDPLDKKRGELNAIRGNGRRAQVSVVLTLGLPPLTADC